MGIWYYVSGSKYQVAGRLAYVLFQAKSEKITGNMHLDSWFLTLAAKRSKKTTEKIKK